MSIRRELMLAVGTLALLNLLLAFGAMGLLLRMGPAIGEILQENDYSIEATEGALVALAASGPGPLPEEARDRVRRGVERARSNQTEPEEIEVIASMERLLDAALDGSPVARRELIGSAERLIDINREAMMRVDREAQRLGRAGAWAAAALGIVSTGAGLLLARRFRRRLAEPVAELHGVLRSFEEGETHRRCRSADAPAEIGRMTASVNRLLDRCTRGPGGARPGGGEAADRAALLDLLDRQEGGTVFVDATGTLRAVSDRALERLAAPGGDAIRAELSSLPRTEETGGLPFRVHPVRDGYGWLCFLPA